MIAHRNILNRLITGCYLLTPEWAIIMRRECERNYINVFKISPQI